MIHKTLDERMKEFALYHRDGDGECNAILLKAYADAHGLTAGERFDLAYFFSIVYCCESGIILFLNREDIKKDPESTAAKLKPEMIFQSDRKYMRMRECFVKALRFWARSNLEEQVGKFINNGVLMLENATRCVQRWYMFGRFSAYLFLETYATLLDAPVTEMSIDWKNGDTATSGLLNLFGHDRAADEFDKTGRLFLSADRLDTYLAEVKKNVSVIGGDTNTTKLETSLCAYRKFYKASRYNGFYLDRMLSELVWYKKLPEFSETTSELFSLRRALFPDELLGEKHGWDGVRTEAKKLYREYGII